MRTPYAPTEKRSELVRAATRLFHEQGFQCTTIANVAQAAEVPLGNVYYYFRTKEALAEAVITSHEGALRTRFDAWAAAHSDPRLRLRCLVRAPLDSAETVIQFGCPHGTLCQELGKLGPDAPLATAASRILTVYIEWGSEQFEALGVARREAGALATDLTAALQGTMLVAHSMRSRALLTRQVRRLEGWLDKQILERTRTQRS